MTVVDLAAWSRCLDAPELDVGHARGATWPNVEEQYHLAPRQQTGLQDCPDSELVDVVRDVETAQCVVLTRLDALCQAVRPEVG